MKPGSREGLPRPTRVAPGRTGATYPTEVVTEPKVGTSETKSGSCTCKRSFCLNPKEPAPTEDKQVRTKA